MDLSFLQKRCVTIKQDAAIVSILVLMYLSFLHELKNGIEVSKNNVSILVLMDLSFLHVKKINAIWF